MFRNLSPDERHDRYWEAVTAADRNVDAALARIRRLEDAGQYTPAEAAGARVEALEAHLAAVRQLRQEHLGAD
jgi:uncharacterized protein YceH (UPF0502 family)